MKTKIFIALTTLLSVACGRFGNTHQKSENSERLVVISKQYNELIYALGAEKNVVAVDVSSVYPPKIKELPTVGYHRALSLEGLLASKPSLILHNGLKSLGPEHIVKQLQDLKIPMKEFENKGKDLESTKALMREMGAYFGKQQAADSLCKKLDADMQKALTEAEKYTHKPKVLVIHFGRASNVYLVMTKNGTANKMVEWAGGEMAIDGTRGMRHLSAEVITQSNPDVILLTDFGYDRLGSQEKIKELPGVSATNAAKNNRIYRVNEVDMVYLGPRTGETTLKLQKLIHEGFEDEQE